MLIRLMEEYCTIKRLVAHEFGHAIAYSYHLEEDVIIKSLYEKYKHGFENMQEFIAECFMASELTNEVTAKRELQEETGAIKFEIKPICVYSVTGKTRVNDTGEETFGLLCFAEITEFAKELHSEMEKVVLMDELPENWTYPLIQPKLIEKYLQVKIIL